MIISVVSGKGGAGKTTIATSLAHILASDYYDLDVDAPNGEHFLQPEFDSTWSASVLHPEIDTAACTGCGDCARECRFNALYKIREQIYLNEHLCHSCNLCREVCPVGAISYQQVTIGDVRSGKSSRTGHQVVVGDLIIGSTRGTALIQDIAQRIDPSRLTIIDGPPGNSCSAVAAIKPADLIVLVIEPSPFGIHDMLQTLEILRQLNKPLVAIANKSLDDTELIAVLKEQDINLATSIPLSSKYHKSLLQGEVLSQAYPEIFQQLQQAVAPEVSRP